MRYRWGMSGIFFFPKEKGLFWFLMFGLMTAVEFLPSDKIPVTRYLFLTWAITGVLRVKQNIKCPRIEEVRKRNVIRSWSARSGCFIVIQQSRNLKGARQEINMCPRYLMSRAGNTILNFYPENANNILMRYWTLNKHVLNRFCLLTHMSIHLFDRQLLGLRINPKQNYKVGSFISVVLPLSTIALSWAFRFPSPPSGFGAWKLITLRLQCGQRKRQSVSLEKKKNQGITFYYLWIVRIMVSFMLFLLFYCNDMPFHNKKKMMYI